MLAGPEAVLVQTARVQVLDGGSGLVLAELGSPTSALRGAAVAARAPVVAVRPGDEVAVSVDGAVSRWDAAAEALALSDDGQLVLELGEQVVARDGGDGAVRWTLDAWAGRAAVSPGRHGGRPQLRGSLWRVCTPRTAPSPRAAAQHPTRTRPCATPTTAPGLGLLRALRAAVAGPR
ncbi:MAG: hypothetical protein R3F59_06140 [Myxococcota bacterium]